MKITLSQICDTRSGNKDDTPNIGLIVQKTVYYTIIQKYVTTDEERIET